ncbi:glycoside hydrolase family 2 protein [Paenibacillus mendelii]|uniref:beta-mannosidase n=1 Tax=Paenibacillus mendelii TaxID=206163 RepID=A0ABV6JIG7_9BACL|nr:glycoside hydrolase family 2 TIM barrel-domain containing protein [Paenibacillus mendelii]MCQ6558477.1 hypothetical protein [Paenibacillus mendelii]
MRIELNQPWMMTGSFHRFWEFGRSMELNTELRGIIPWIPAEVPGSVHWDLHRAGIIPDPYWEMQSLSSEWVNERDWLYRTEFQTDPSWKGKKVRLVCEGIDYAGKIRFNGMPIYEHEGMFTPAVVDLTPHLNIDAPNSLLIGISKSPEGIGQLGYTNEVDHLKSRFGYKWDFSPRLIHTGLWKPVSLWITGRQWISDMHVRTEVNGDAAIAYIRLELESETGGSALLNVQISSPDGSSCSQLTKSITGRPGIQTVHVELPIANPQLWWPNGSGEQPLYKVEAQIWDSEDGSESAADSLSDARSTHIGIRSLAFHQNPDSPEESLAYTIAVNNQPIYIKGWNWVPVDQLYGRERKQHYERLIELAKQANVNLLRVWGGGLIERELFYDLCDRAGIMIWQEMMQSSSGFNNEPSSSPSYMYSLYQVMRCVIKEKRNHPSLVIWCGGNELTEGGHLNASMVPLSDQFPALRVLRDLVADLDSEKLYLATSPTGPTFFLNAEDSGKGKLHDVHGPWKYAGVEEHYRLYNNSDALLHSEYGGDGYASITSMRKFLGAEWLQAEQADSLPWLHHGYEFWNMKDQIHSLFGSIADLATQVQVSQWLQAEGIRYGVESNRRRAPRCSGSILWQMNEPFPNVSCTNAVDYYGDPKLAYSWVARANRSLHVSMRYDRLVYLPGEAFQGELYLTRDGGWRETSRSGEEPHQLIVKVRDAAGRMFHEHTVSCNPDGGMTESLGSCSWEIPMGLSSFYVSMALIGCNDDRLAENEYAFTVTLEGARGEQPLRPFLELGRTHLNVTLASVGGTRQELLVHNDGKQAALWVRIEGLDGEDLTYRPLQDGFIVFPGETISCMLEAGNPIQRYKVYALNVPELEITVNQ